MLYYDKTDVSEGIDVMKTSESEERVNYHYWYFLKKGFKFQSYICNRCYDLLMMSMNLSGITILKIKIVDYLKGTNFRGYKFSRNKFSRLDGSKWASFAELIFAVE